MKGDSTAGNGNCSSCGHNSGNGSGSGHGNGHNNDKAIARLLYAMLKQKCLKDIDWNRVACDPVLLEEISNGHAARMRFSRFRTTVENQRRNRQARLSGGSTSSAVSAVSAASAASMSTFRVSKPKRDTRDSKVGKNIVGLSRKRLVEVTGEDADIKRDQSTQEEDMDLSPRPLSPPDESMVSITQPKRGDRLAGPARPLAPIKTESQLFGTSAQASSPLFVPGHGLARNFSSSSAPEMLPSSYHPRIRDLTPCSDDQNSPEMTAAPLPPSTDAFRFATAASAAAAAAAHYGNGRSPLAMSPPWMSHAQQQPMLSCPPFSPPLGVYDMATLDTAGFANSDFCPGNLSPQPPTTQDGMHLVAYGMGQPGMTVFPRHDGMWDTLLGHGNDLNQHHGI